MYVCKNTITSNINNSVLSEELFLSERKSIKNYIKKAPLGSFITVHVLLQPFSESLVYHFESLICESQKKILLLKVCASFHYF